MNDETQVGSSLWCARMAARRCWVTLSRPRSLSLASTARRPVLPLNASMRDVETHVIESRKVPWMNSISLIAPDGSSLIERDALIATPAPTLGATCD
jgi:hypothetical protein